MKIGFFSESYLPRNDGVAHSIESFRIELERMGHEVYIIAPSPKLMYKETNPRVIRFTGVKNVVIEDYPTSVFFPPTAVNAVEELNLDIIHFHTPTQIGLLGAYVAIRNRIPLITTYHTDLFEYVTHYPRILPAILALTLVTPLALGGDIRDFQGAISMMKPERNVDAWNQRIVQRMTTVIHNRCDLLIAPSIKVNNQLKSWGTKSPIVVLPTGVDKITTNSAKIKQVMAHLNLAPTDKAILFVGRLGTEKNVELLVKSFPLVQKRVKDVRLIVVGDHPNRLKLMELAAQLGISDSVIFTGYVSHEDLGAYYALSSVFAFPSTTDTQALVLQEAAHAGLPIVMIDKEISEVVKEDVNCLFAKPNTADFSAKLITLLTNNQLRKKMSQSSPSLAEDFTAGKQAAKLLSLYQDVIQNYEVNHAISRDDS